MYPRARVKVIREQEQQDGQVSPPNDTGSVLFLRLLESLSLQDCSLPKENHCNSPSANAKVSNTTYVPNVNSKLVIASKGKNSTDINKDTKPNARVSSIPRPRAVLSSPENDDMIGNRNRFQKYGTPSSSKKLNPEQKIPAQIAAIPRPVKPRSLLSARKGTRDAISDNNRVLTRSKSSKSGIQRQKASLQQGKSSSTAF